METRLTPLALSWFRQSTVSLMDHEKSRSLQTTVELRGGRYGSPLPYGRALLCIIYLVHCFAYW